jgi:hypothetical protein
MQQPLPSTRCPALAREVPAAKPTKLSPPIPVDVPGPSLLPAALAAPEATTAAPLAVVLVTAAHPRWRCSATEARAV